MILYSKTNEMLPSDDISTLTEYKLFTSSVVQLNGVPSTIKKTAAYYISDIHKKIFITELCHAIHNAKFHILKNNAR